MENKKVIEIKRKRGAAVVKIKENISNYNALPNVTVKITLNTLCKAVTGKEFYVQDKMSYEQLELMLKKITKLYQKRRATIERKKVVAKMNKRLNYIIEFNGAKITKEKAWYFIKNLMELYFYSGSEGSKRIATGLYKDYKKAGGKRIHEGLEGY